MNTEIIKVARKAAAHYKNSDGYAQAAEIITMLCDELEKTRRPVATPTVKDVLLKTWAHDTEDMQCAFVHKDMSGGYWYMTKNKYGMFCWMWTLDHSDAMRKQAEFLNSAAEVEK